MPHKLPTKKLSAKAQLMKAKGLLNNRNELMLYGIIGDWIEGMDAATIVSELSAIDEETIVVRIHSPGGYITEGLAMYNALAQSDRRIEVHIDGLCASMATVVAAAGDVIYTPDNALWMVHRAHNMVQGHADEMREAADTLEVFEQSLLLAYSANGRVSEDRLKEIFATGKDYFMTGAEAVAEGFADELTAPVKAAAALDLSSLQTPTGEHKKLFDFYHAVNAAHHPNQEEHLMTLKQLLAQKAALTEKGVAASAIVSALAVAFNVEESHVEALLAEGSKATAKQLEAGMSALAAIQVPSSAAPAQSTTPAEPQAGMDPQAAIATERKRIADINALAMKHGLPEAQKNTLISDGSTIEQARAMALEYLSTHDHARQPTPGVRTIDTSGTAFAESMANAMLNRMQPGRFKLEESGRDFRGMNLLDMAAQCLERGGISTRGFTRNELAAKALHTTSDFPEIVADVANKVLIAAYQAQPRTFLPIANQATLSDFKAKHAIEIGGGSDLAEVLENGEFEQGTVSESKRSYKLTTFGRIFAMTRQLLINDDIGAFTQFLSNIGALAARKESQVVWSLVKTGAIYSSGNKNLGTGGAVSETTLSELRKLMRQMKGLDDEPINVSARYLVVNSDRETEAQKLLSSVLASATGDVNVFANSLELITEPLLDGVSNNPWYAFADPMLVPTLEYAYLEGETGPYIETKNGFEVDGIQVKVRHDFGAGWVSHRGSVKNPGA
ncbi:MAG: ClpP-like prohead protease/major capsid protein fusion protein [Porticoccus sp.]|uniref:ClpP-like prohead protease/major capsid protein fusion protein n=1 Tax=Porticoccus sp. TaxID=2024853 RepID=UPI0032991620